MRATLNAICVIYGRKIQKRYRQCIGLKQLKSMVGNYKLSFAGGEILLKKDVFEIFEICNRENISFGVTTNGILLSSDNVNKLLEFNPMNINISLDSLKNDVYQQIRGVPALEHVKSNIQYLMGHKEIGVKNIKVYFKTVVNNFNLNELHEIAQYAMDQKTAGITFDPIKRPLKLSMKTAEQFEAMTNIDKEQLQKAIRKLIHLKKQGFRILNSENNMNQWFINRDANIGHFCTVPLQNFRLFRVCCTQNLVI